MSIVARHLVKRFGDFTAVDQIDLEVTPGSIFGFLGPNGSGKSTTVKMLTGLLPPTSGEAIVNGIALAADPVAVKKSIGVLPEQLALFEALTIEEHLRLAGPIYGLSEEETTTRTWQLLKFLDLYDERHTRAGQCSYGMGKKTGLAMAVLHNPRTLFLDEPFEGIDPSSAENIRQLLQMVASKGGTVFITSHILEVVQNLVDTYAIIADGRIVARGTIAALAGRPLKDVYFRHIPQAAAEEFPWLG